MDYNPNETRRRIAERRLMQKQALKSKNGLLLKTPPKELKVVRQKEPKIILPPDVLSVQVAQGLGDIFWVYQKLAPHFEKIAFQISVNADDQVNRRSEKWLRLLPKVTHVHVKKMSGTDYETFVKGKFYVKDVLRHWERGRRQVLFCCNRFLEEGVRLEEIEELAIEETVPIETEKFALPHDDYVTLYISGSTKGNSDPNKLRIWSVEEWLELLDGIYDKYSVRYPVSVIGAEFDREAVAETERLLKKRNIPVVCYVQNPPAKVCHILKNSKLFLGYQSGLNIIADNFDVQQVMIYFKHLEKMQYTWCKKKNIQTQFNAGLFTESPAEIVKRLDNLKL